MDKDGTGDSAGNLQDRPSSPAGGFSVVLTLPRELGVRLAFTQAVSGVEPCVEGAEGHFTSTSAEEGDVGGLNEIAGLSGPSLHLDDPPLPPESLCDSGRGHCASAGSASSFGARTRL